MSYIEVTFTEYHLNSDEFIFKVKTSPDNDNSFSHVLLTGDEIYALKEQYDASPDQCGQGMSIQDVAIMCILHDQDDITSDDPTEFVGRSFVIEQ